VNPGELRRAPRQHGGRGRGGSTGPLPSQETFRSRLRPRGASGLAIRWCCIMRPGSRPADARRLDQRTLYQGPIDRDPGKA
jgi:hypothetical protein